MIILMNIITHRKIKIIKKKETSLMINKNRYHKILTRRKENVSKDREEENLETREEKKNGGRAKKS